MARLEEEIDGVRIFSVRKSKKSSISYKNIIGGLIFPLIVFVSTTSFVSGYMINRLSKGETKEELKIEFFTNTNTYIPDCINVPMQFISMCGLESGDKIYKSYEKMKEIVYQNMRYGPVIIRKKIKRM